MGLNKYFLFSVFMVLNTCLSQSIQTNWEYLHPQPQSNSLFWIGSIDQNTFISVGQRGAFLKTTDKGQTWDFTTIGNNPTIRIQPGFWSGFVVTPQKQILIGSSHKAFLTIDQGKNFQSLMLPSKYAFGKSDLFDIVFIDTLIGYIAGSNLNDQTGQLIKTTDGGNTWNVLNNFLSLTACAIAAKDSIVIVGTTTGEMIRSTDGGMHWSDLQTTAGNEINKIAMLNADTAFFIISGSQTIGKTINGGKNWSLLSGPPSQFGLVDIDITRNGINVVTIYVTGDTSRIFKSIDYGASWQPIQIKSADQNQNGLGDNNRFYSSVVYDDDTIVSVGKNGIVSVRSGNTITSQQYKVTNHHLYDIWASKSGEKIIAIGDVSSSSKNDQMLISPDGGNNWFTVPGIATDEGLMSICMVDESVGYIAGTWGAVLKTEGTNGEIWDLLQTPIKANLSTVKFVDKKTGWIFGDSGRVLKTTNGGMHWIDQSPGIEDYIKNACFVDSLTGWFITGRSFSFDTCSVFKTTNGGTSWQKMPKVTSHTPRWGGKKIFMLDKNVGYMVAHLFNGFGGVAKTTDGGVSWDSVPAPYYDGMAFIDLFVKDTNNLFLLTSQWSARTTNGGATWQIDPVTGEGFGLWTQARELGSMYGHSIDTIYAAGAYGGIYRYYHNPHSTSVIEWKAKIPSEYQLMQNYPNPFNPRTTINFSLQHSGKVSLRIFDALGREVQTVINNVALPAGSLSYKFDGSHYSSGVYYYSLIVNGQLVGTKKMVLVK